jgi:MFS family permease
MSEPVPKRSWLNRTVLALGGTSLFSDISHEMGTAVLPLFLKQLGAGAAALGIIEGVATLLMSVGKLYGGSIGDRLRLRKWLTGTGYLLTTLGIGSYVVAGSWWHVLLGRAGAWFGRGFRGPLRDALIAEAVEPEDYGKSYGLERAGDTAGACIGPLITALLLWLMLPLRLILGLVMIPGFVAVALVWGLVREQPRERPGPTKRMSGRLRELPPAFRRFLLAIAVFSLGDYSNTLLIMWAAGHGVSAGLQQRALEPILLYAGYNAVSALVSYVSGALSDRWGRRWLLVGGYSCGVVAAFLVAQGEAPALPLMAAAFGLSGIAMGNQEALEKAYAADTLRPDERSLGFGVLALVNGLGKLFASAVVGVLWSWVGITVAFGVAAGLSAVGVVLLVVLTNRRNA